LPSNHNSRADWKREGLRLGRLERATAFDIGDWYIIGCQQYGRGVCRRIVEAPDWRGVKWDSLKVYATVARRFPKALRRLNASPSHHQAVSSLDDGVALPLLDGAPAGCGASTQKPCRRRAAMEHANEREKESV
jgi:hypothetical protein